MGVKVCILANWPIRPADGVLVHCRVTPFPRIKFASTHLNNRAERGIAVRAREKCLDQEHNTMSPTRSRTQTARSGVECANHGATATPLLIRWQDFNRGVFTGGKNWFPLDINIFKAETQLKCDNRFLVWENKFSKTWPEKLSGFRGELGRPGSFTSDKIFGDQEITELGFNRVEFNPRTRNQNVLKT